MKRAAVINDISGFGRCSLTAAIPVISVQGIQACPLPTAVLSNQTGYESYFCADFTDNMRSYIAEWEKLGYGFDAILTGFASDERQIDIIEEFCEKFKADGTLLVVDPVMGDNGKTYDFYTDALCGKFRNLVSKADITTPNLSELCILTDTGYSSVMKKAYTPEIKEIICEKASLLLSSGTKTVIVTSVPLYEGKITNLIVADGKIQEVSSTDFGGSFSGTGDLFVSSVCASVLKGESVFDAVSRTVFFLSAAIQATLCENIRKEDGICFEPFLKLL